MLGYADHVGLEDLADLAKHGDPKKIISINLMEHVQIVHGDTFKTMKQHHRAVRALKDGTRKKENSSFVFLVWLDSTPTSRVLLNANRVLRVGCSQEVVRPVATKLQLIKSS